MHKLAQYRSGSDADGLTGRTRHTERPRRHRGKFSGGAQPAKTHTHANAVCRPTIRRMRASYSLLLLALATAPVFAQNTSQNTPQGTPAEREQLSNKEQPAKGREQRVERIHVEDAGSRVDELRVGGQTRSISVQPKTGNMPSYEVQSPDGPGNRTGSQNGAETNTAPRVWNVLKF